MGSLPVLPVRRAVKQESWLLLTQYFIELLFYYGEHKFTAVYIYKDNVNGMLQILFLAVT